MSPSVKALPFNIIILLGTIASALCNCVINVEPDPALRPSFYKYFGSHKHKINTSRTKTIVLNEYQKIEARCETTFANPDPFKSVNVAYISCKHGNIYVSSNKEGNMNYSQSFNINCSTLNWNLYELHYNFDWCPYKATSYILAEDHSLASTNPYSLAEICYDIDSLSLNSVYYSLGPDRTQNEKPALLEEVLSGSSTKIEYVRETFGVNSISESVFAETQFQKWITDFKYDFDLIIQHKKLHKAFKDDLGSLVEILWWPNLRLYNWKLYLNSLEEHIEKDNKTYDILAGVSGTVTAPLLTNCQKNYTMNEMVFDSDRKIPLYVWNYLRERDSSSKGIVVIGLNSPFHEFYDPKDTKFCIDRCREVSWLQEASSLFRFNIMGSIICCDVDDVRYSDRLEGFPQSDMEPYQTTELPYDIMTNIYYG